MPCGQFADDVDYDETAGEASVAGNLAAVRQAVSAYRQERERDVEQEMTLDIALEVAKEAVASGALQARIRRAGGPDSIRTAYRVHIGPNTRDGLEPGGMYGGGLQRFTTASAARQYIQAQDPFARSVEVVGRVDDDGEFFFEDPDALYGAGIRNSSGGSYWTLEEIRAEGGVGLTRNGRQAKLLPPDNLFNHA